jgi:hypothetical protein
MCLFQDLHPECLCGIIDLLNAYELGYLWLCGSKNVNWKLSKAGGARSFQFSQDSFHLDRWPSLVSHLDHLTYISIVVCGVEDCYSQLVPNLPSLPNSVTDLLLHFTDAQQHFDSAYSANPTQFSKLATLECSGLMDKRPSNLIQFHIPSITRLTFAALAMLTLDNLDIGVIPTTLTHFTCHMFRTLVNPSEKSFPSSLTSLDLRFDSYWDFLRYLPPDLTHLQVASRYSKEDTQNYEWNYLPRGLTSLSFSSMKFCSLSFIKSLPSGLLSLTMLGTSFSGTSETSVEILRSLPPKLTSFPSSGLGKKLTASILAALPRSLKSLPYGSLDWENAHLLPSGAETVRLRQSKGLPYDDSLIQSIPPQLYILDIDVLTPRIAKMLPESTRIVSVGNGPLSTEMLQNLPTRNLRGLYLVHGVPFEEENDFKAIPRDLNKLDMLPSPYNMPDELPPIFSIKNVESSSWLPRGLVDLTLGLLDINDSEWFLQLPPTLESIRFSVLDLPKDSLLKLPCQSTLRIFELCLHTSPQHGWASIIATLPRKLTVVIITRNADSEPSDITDEHLANLPSPLTTIALPHSPLVTGSCVPNLPLYLDRISLGRQTPPWLLDHFATRSSRDRLSQR